VEAKRFGYYPSVIHSDQGTEFINSELQLYCNKNAIQQPYSDAYTPQKNGLAKRFNGTILESLKTLILDSGLRQNLWSKILSTSILTLNQIPSH
jgi:transposase InsO family protein